MSVLGVAVTQGVAQRVALGVALDPYWLLGLLPQGVAQGVAVGIAQGVKQQYLLVVQRVALVVASATIEK